MSEYATTGFVCLVAGLALGFALGSVLDRLGRRRRAAAAPLPARIRPAPAVRYWFKPTNQPWHEVTADAYADSHRSLEYWEARGGLPDWLEGCQLLELPAGQYPPGYRPPEPPDLG